MLPEIKNAILVLSSSLAVSTLAKATVIMALGLIAARLARRSQASVRHALLAVTFGALLALPAASILTPPVRIAAPIVVETPAVPPAFDAAAGAISPIGQEDTKAGVTPSISRSSVLSTSILLLVGWIAGVSLFLLPMAMGIWQLRSLRRSGLPWQSGQSLADGLALDAGIRTPVEVLLHEALPGPMTCGVIHPAIVLPVDARIWNEAELSRVLVHELEHVRRRDWLSHGLARAVCALYWFHPLVWIALRQLGLEAERACDDAVLTRSEATAYADQLVGIAERFSKAAKPPLLAMANRADLAKRVRAVLDSRQHRGRAGRFPVLAAGAIAAVLVLTMSPLTMVALPQSAGGATGQPTAADAAFRFEAASIRPSPPDASGNTINNRRDSFEVRNWPVSWMITYAYFIHGAQLTGRPDWIDIDRFDITAKPDQQRESESETRPGPAVHQRSTRTERGSRPAGGALSTTVAPGTEGGAGVQSDRG